MRLNILIGGKAGQGINKISEIISKIITELGYFTFNYRDYQSLIRGGHNFNVISISDYKIGSVETKLDCIVALDEKTKKIHKKELKNNGFVIDSKNFESFGKNLNLALSGALLKILGIEKNYLLEKIKKEFQTKEALDAAEKGFDSQTKKFEFKKLNRKIYLMDGSEAIAQGAINSNIDLYLAYPMTPSTPLMAELAKRQEEKNLLVFEPEGEISVINTALGASFAGAKVMIGTSGGGFDLMVEAISFQGMTEIPLVLYLASRAGPSTGMPTYTSQADLNDALRAGHGEFPRVVIAPGDPLECIEKTNEAFYLSEKFGVLSIILSDKHLAESGFSFDKEPKKPLKIEIKRKVPGKGIIRTSSYEHDEFANTTEDAEMAKRNAECRLKKYEKIKKECQKFQMIKKYGNENAENLIISWGSNKTVILDALDEIDESVRNPKKGKWKFLHVLYLKPLSDEIKKEILKSKRVILIENNSTGQLGRLIREKTGISIKDRILKYDGRPFYLDELKNKILNLLNK